ncbi:MAG: fructose-6-phosphate aldolase [Holosporaceae bacterium]|jgi:transaldolase|nr:fructose-6-phosphate aldolase [Holosporaceae bacterium]
MEIFLDTADVDYVAFYKSFIDGVTMNPSLVAKSGRDDYEGLIKEICQQISGHVSIEVISNGYDDMLVEAKQLAKIYNNVCIKLPCTFDGLRACRKLSSDGIPTNLTLCFSSTQALLAAKCGATYVSPFVGRLDDIGHDGVALLEEIVNIFATHEYETRVLAASIRNLQHLIQAALIGVNAVTLSPQILQQCFDHPLTIKGLEIFKKDWENKQ